ncbi:MAG: ATP synthase F1 subunit delta [Calditrichia bacterium]
MRRSRVAKRYAKALFELALSEKKVAAVAADLDMLESSYQNVEELREVIASPVIAKHKKQDVVEKAFKKSIQPLSFEFLSVLIKKGREAELIQIIDECRRMIDESNGVVRGTVSSVVPLSSGQLADLKKKLDSMTSKDVQLEQQVDESLLGGFVVQIDDMVYDNSLKHQLGKLKESLSQ